MEGFDVKKILCIALIAMMILNCFSFVTFAENYDFTLSILADKASYSAGEEIELSIVADKDFETSNGRINITYNEELIEIKTKAYKSEVSAFPFNKENATIPGEYLLNWADTENYEVKAGEVMIYLYFTVKEDIKGVDEINIRWIKDKSENIQSWVMKYEEDYVTENIHNVKFKDLTLNTIGSELEDESEYLPVAFANASANDLLETTINGESVNINTDYAVAFGKIAVRKADVTRVEAGFLLSKTNDNMTLDNLSIKKFKAINISSENIFGGLFYGPGLEAGQTYYVMPYVTYSDKTLYAQNPVSFTMPE